MIPSPDHTPITCHAALHISLSDRLFFLTRIPVGGFPYSTDEWRWASGWFPFVGLVIGTAMAATWLAVAQVGGFPAAVLVTGLGMLLTGAFHEDGMADTADAARRRGRPRQGV